MVSASSPLTSLTDIKGKKVAATPGTDPHIFLLRALESVGMTDKDIVLKPLPHAEGRAALEKGEVDAWAGLDPIMAQSELVAKSRLLFRDPVLNTYGILNVREAFAVAHPELVKRVLKVYDQARLYAAGEPRRTARGVGRRGKDRRCRSFAAIGADGPAQLDHRHRATAHHHSGR